MVMDSVELVVVAAVAVGTENGGYCGCVDCVAGKVVSAVIAWRMVAAVAVLTALTA